MEGMLTALKTLIQDPTSNLVATALGLGIVTLLALVLVLGLLLWALSKTRWSPEPRPRTMKPARQMTRADKLRDQGARLLPLFLFIAALFVGYGGTSVNDYCGRTCHQMLSASDSWKTSSHKKTACIRCHEGIPVLSAAQGVVSRVRCVLYRTEDMPGQGTSSIPSSRCLGCHRKIASSVIEGRGAVRMSHKEVIEAGGACDDCHGIQGHERLGRAIGMGPCMRCHDGVKVSSDCAICHPRGSDLSIVATEMAAGIGVGVRLPDRPRCGGCHSEKKCDACHGLRMPHPEDFYKAERHARLAAWEKKDKVCRRCHDLGMCQNCHLIFAAHVGDWKEDHKKAPRDGTWCKGCHDTEYMCGLCHPWKPPAPPKPTP